MRKRFSILGIVVCALIVLFGILLLTRALEKKTGNEDADTILAAVDEVTSTATIRTASGILIIGFGLFGICLFGALMEEPKTKTVIIQNDQHTADKREAGSSIVKQTERQSAEEISREMQEQLGIGAIEASQSVIEKPGKKEINTLPEMLAYAAKFTSDPGMTGYLQREKDKLPEEDSAKVEELLKLPPKEIREAIKKMV